MMIKNNLPSGGGKSEERTAVFNTSVVRTQAARDSADLIVHAIAGVLRLAQDGDLPLFAWTLGLPQDTWLRMLNTFFPELGALEPMSPSAYLVIEKATPKTFQEIATLLFEQRSPDVEDSHADWLARAIAAGCLGGRQLWQDLGLRGRDEASALFAIYFPALHQKNSQHLGWKHFLFDELAA